MWYISWIHPTELVSFFLFIQSLSTKLIYNSFYRCWLTLNPDKYCIVSPSIRLDFCVYFTSISIHPSTHPPIRPPIGIDR
ncbi:hypothetical protein P175DRAFT_0554571 [Aspergillus ochraceoroseus IBT 24754]|uniref:Uncharacterized protein n=1 Tax=Aspergillus ochraceoroseus IBT 24754 TaxID=1392256 RepID=A0A2T5M9Z4_9EURO|nr:uncharacterized protein P175DRAFT_0554571 [Aspergillus ochraceoroseus IBT 24754]PTU25325.1 hypothetical protein P175DRAFT_0554571 [Aspergillus ochraceoroseus IBT 24754]